jgi:hypothetical protein
MTVGLFHRHGNGESLRTAVVDLVLSQQFYQRAMRSYEMKTVYKEYYK